MYIVTAFVTPESNERGVLNRRLIIWAICMFLRKQETT